MPSRTIRPTEAPVATPFAYTVGTAEGLSPEAVVASWDGTGTGSDFYPCVSYYNAEGVLMDRAFPDGVTMHPGDTAEVSYRPFKRGSGGSAAVDLIVEDFITAVHNTTDILFTPPLRVTEIGPGLAEIDLAISTAPVFTSAYTLAQTSPSVGGGNFPRVVLTQMYGAGFTYGASPNGNHGTTLQVTETGLYALSYNIATLSTNDDTQLAVLSFGPDGGHWAAGDAPFPFGINDRFVLASSINEQGLGGGGHPVGGSVLLHLTAGEVLSFGLGSGAIGVNISIDHGLFGLEKVG